MPDSDSDSSSDRSGQGSHKSFTNEPDGASTVGGSWLRRRVSTLSFLSRFRNDPHESDVEQNTLAKKIDRQKDDNHSEVYKTSRNNRNSFI